MEEGRAAAAAAAAADQFQLLLSMLDFYWFEHQVLLSTRRGAPPINSPSQLTSPGVDVVQLPPITEAEKEKEKPPDLQIHRPLRRSFSEEITTTSSVSPPTTLLVSRPHRTLDTILSGKEKESSPPPPPLIPEEEREEAEPLEEENSRGSRGRRSRKDAKSRSLSDLEFEELKGFMDLGFTFSEKEAANPRLVSIVPGLQRLAGKKKEEEAAEKEEESTVARPYLSEAWEAEEARRRRRDWEREVRRRREEERALRNWRIPPAGDDDVDLKNHIRFWAHTVASAVR